MTQTKRIEALASSAVLSWTVDQDADGVPRVWFVEWSLYSSSGAHAASPNEPIATGTCKSDGCAEVRPAAGFFHVCGPRDLVSLGSRLEWIYLACAEITGGDALDECRDLEWL
jgi:hypothetical protein